MAVNPDFRDLFAALNAAGARYLLVGGYAVAFHAEPRFTKDLDVWAEPSPANAARVHEALQAFGASLQDLTQGDLARAGLVFQIGVPPNRIDIVTAIDGVMYSMAGLVEYAVVPATDVFPLPDALPLAESSVLGCALWDRSLLENRPLHPTSQPTRYRKCVAEPYGPPVRRGPRDMLLEPSSLASSAGGRRSDVRGGLGGTPGRAQGPRGIVGLSAVVPAMTKSERSSQ